MTMKKITAGVVLALAAGTALADWLPIKADPMVRVMADPVTIRRSGDMVTMWSLINYVKPQKTGDGKSYLSSKQYREYNCAERLSRRLELSRHAENTGWGQVLDSNKTPGAWSPATAGSVAGELLKFACGEK